MSPTTQMSTTTKSTTPAMSFNHSGAKMNARSVSPATIASCLISRLSSAGESVSAKLVLRCAGITRSALYSDAGAELPRVRVGACPRVQEPDARRRSNWASRAWISRSSRATAASTRDRHIKRVVDEPALPARDDGHHEDDLREDDQPDQPVRVAASVLSLSLVR